MAADSGGYHLPSEAFHHPGPCEVSLIFPPVPHDETSPQWRRECGTDQRDLHELAAFSWTAWRWIRFDFAWFLQCLRLPGIGTLGHADHLQASSGNMGRPIEPGWRKTKRNLATPPLRSGATIVAACRSSYSSSRRANRRASARSCIGIDRCRIGSTSERPFPWFTTDQMHARSRHFG